MINVELVELPGAGASPFSVPYGTTIEQFLNQRGKTGYTVCVDGIQVSGHELRRELRAGQQVFVTRPTKGN